MGSQIWYDDTLLPPSPSDGIPRVSANDIESRVFSIGSPWSPKTETKYNATPVDKTLGSPIDFKVVFNSADDCYPSLSVVESVAETSAIVVGRDDGGSLVSRPLVNDGEQVGLHAWGQTLLA